MRLLLVSILLHKPHEEDEKNRGSGDANNDRNNHIDPSNGGNDDNISISNSNLSNNLIIDTSNEVIQIWIYASKSVYLYP